MSTDSLSEKSKKKEATNSALYEITHGNAVYVMAFIVPLIIMIAIYMMRKIYPFGDNIYLRSDCYHQYAPFFSELWEKIHSGSSLQYSWDIGMGTNFLAIFGYYLSSPVNWFVALFPQKSILLVMDIIIALKIAGSGLTFTIYLCNHKKQKNMLAAIFGLFYALSGFITAYSWNLMWLDCVLLFPLIALGLEKLVNEGKGLLYVITLGLAILSNYYISIMICISLVIYFFVLMFSRKVPEHKSEYVKSTLRFIGYSLLAGAFAAVLLLPEMMALQYTASGEFSFPKTLTRYFSFITIFERQLINVEVELGLDHYPNIYCGVAIFVLLPLFIMTKKIGKREKVAKVIAIFIFLTAFNMNIPNYVWHGFHYPNSLPCRQSFIYVFLLLAMCYDGALEIHEFSNKQIAGSFWGVILFLLYLGNTITDSDVVSFKSIYTSAIFMGIYVLIIFAIRKWKKATSYLVILVYAVAIIEATMNTEQTGYSTTGYSPYFSDYESVATLTDNIEKEDTSFYRISKAIGYRSKNDSAWHNYMGCSTFSSTAYAGLTSFYGELGLEHSTNAYSISGATPIVYSILNVKYLLSNTTMETSDIMSLKDSEGSEYLYENNYVLPLGFVVPSDLNLNLNYKYESNPFRVQNNFIYYSTGISDVLTPISFEHSGSQYTYTVPEDQYIYVYIQNTSVKTAKVLIDGESRSFTGIDHGRTVDIGLVRAGSTITIYDSDNENSDLQLLSYIMDSDKYIEAMNILSENGFNVTSYTDTTVNGTVDTSISGVMFTSIPYDESWTVYVDSKETKCEKIGDAFLGIPVTSGTHTITMKYKARGYNAGLVLTIISFILIIGMIVFRIKFKQEITEDGSIKLVLTTIHDKKKLPEKKESEE